MTKKSNDPKILLDCDVIIHFIKAGKQLLLPKIFPGRFVILDKVFEELMARPSNKIPVGNFIEYTKIDVIPIPNKIEIIKEYSRLKKIVGNGEAACMAVARNTNDYIASSNLKDIRLYCEEYNIVYLTTMDILLEAYKLKIMSELECDDFIKEVKLKDSKLIRNIDSITAYEKLKK
ncbi:hypothetical protein [Flavobacterium eburneipallidum]|uniref:hypothetical protein n=1 Tax=Flavobacterium eburneipallidum TaxID=3003263 RepID=UPI0022AC8188|nr:hypothetical protein [Flavobacterium eburneipallidum]